MQPAGAQTVSDEEVNKQVVAYFTMLGAGFGCAKLVHSEFGGFNLGELEFLPTDATRHNWKKVYMVGVQFLPEDETLLQPAMGGYNANIVGDIAKTGIIIDVDTKKTRNGLPITYIEYKTKTGFPTDYVVGVYGRHTKGVAAYTRLMSRGEKLDNQDRAMMKRLFSDLADRW